MVQLIFISKREIDTSDIESFYPDAFSSDDIFKALEFINKLNKDKKLFIIIEDEDALLEDFHEIILLDPSPYTILASTRSSREDALRLGANNGISFPIDLSKLLNIIKIEIAKSTEKESKPKKEEREIDESKGLLTQRGKDLLNSSQKNNNSDNTISYLPKVKYEFGVDTLENWDENYSENLLKIFNFPNKEHSMLENSHYLNKNNQELPITLSIEDLWLEPIEEQEKVEVIGEMQKISDSISESKSPIIAVMPESTLEEERKSFNLDSLGTIEHDKMSFDKSTRHEDYNIKVFGINLDFILPKSRVVKEFINNKIPSFPLETKLIMKYDKKYYEFSDISSNITKTDIEYFQSIGIQKLYYTKGEEEAQSSE